MQVSDEPKTVARVSTRKVVTHTSANCFVGVGHIERGAAPDRPFGHGTGGHVGYQVADQN